jgi:hypothetical protein
MTTITIDPSISCTAMVIDDKKFIFTNASYASTKTALDKWFTKCAPFIHYNILPDLPKCDDYSLSEISKLKRFDSIADSIFNTISKNIKCQTDLKIYIEGYSYSSIAGPIIDLVTLGTLIRNKCMSIADEVVIVSPKTLKIETCKFVYTPIQVKKKIEYRNNAGVSGGKFTKTEMCQSLLDSKLDCEWVTFLRDNKDEILKNKSIPKPIEDINDAKLMFEIFKDK